MWVSDSVSDPIFFCEVSVGWRAGAGKETCTGKETFYRRTHGRWGVVRVSWARGGACGVYATCGTSCAGQGRGARGEKPHVAHAPGRGAARAACMPRVARAPGKGADRAVCIPRVAHAPGRGGACQLWHMHREGGRRVRSVCHAWHVPQAERGACGVHATRGMCARQRAERAVGVPRVARGGGAGGMARTWPSASLECSLPGAEWLGLPKGSSSRLGMVSEPLLHIGLRLLLPPLPPLPGERRSESAWSGDKPTGRATGENSAEIHDRKLTWLGPDDWPAECEPPKHDGRDRTDGAEEEPPDGEPEPWRLLSLELLVSPRRRSTRFI